MRIALASQQGMQCVSSTSYGGGLIGSIVGLLGLGLRVPDHMTLSRRAATLDVPRLGSASVEADGEPMRLLVDSTGSKLCGRGEAGQDSVLAASGTPAQGRWLPEKHGTATRRSWHLLHLGVDAGTGRIVAATLTHKGVDDESQADPLLDAGCPARSASTSRPAAKLTVPPRIDAHGTVPVAAS